MSSRQIEEVVNQTMNNHCNHLSVWTNSIHYLLHYLLPICFPKTLSLNHCINCKTQSILLHIYWIANAQFLHKRHPLLTDLVGTPLLEKLVKILSPKQNLYSNYFCSRWKLSNIQISIMERANFDEIGKFRKYSPRLVPFLIFSLYPLKCRRVLDFNEGRQIRRMLKIWIS